MHRALLRPALVTLFLVALLPCAAVVKAQEIESLFAARGPFDTFSDLSTGPGNDFSLFRPADPGQDGFLHPVITWGNGTLAIPLFYFDLLDHLASHGFVVIASNGLFVGSGEEMLEGVDWILEENDNPNSALFGAIDVDAIGATGHSQGGEGAINAGNDARLSCTAPIQPVPGNVDGLQGPMFALAGENDTIVPKEVVGNGVYVPSPVPSIFGVLAGADHFTPLGDAGGFRGYVTAWFAACLAGDGRAAPAFLGACELCDNEDWLTFRKNP